MTLTSSLRRFAAPEPLEARIAPAAVIALDSDNHLLRFDSATPGVITSTLSVSGLVEGEKLVAIDFRPADGGLYGLALLDGAASDDTVARVVRISLLSGAASTIADGVLGSDFADGVEWGFDFNPAADRIRVVNSEGLNLRVNPAGGPVQTDSPLDHPSASESVIGVAYDRSFPGATATTLFGIDLATGNMVRHGGVDGGAPEGSPNGGVLTTIGALGVALGSGRAGFDISPTGLAIASLDEAGTGLTGFYTIDTATGTATRVGTIGSGGPILGIAAVHFNWSGLGSSANWSDPANWWSRMAPQADDLLVFGLNDFEPEPVNDYAPGTQFHSLRIATDFGYFISGNAITLTDGIANFGGSEGVVLALPIKLAKSQTISSTVGVELLLSHRVGVELSGFELTFDGAGRITMNSLISSDGGGGSVVKRGGGSVTLNADNSYAGTTEIFDGVLTILGSQPQSEVIVQGGTLAGSARIADGRLNAGSVAAIGGTVAPGQQGVGTLVTSDLTMDSGSTFSVRVSFEDGGLQSGKVSARGTVTLNNPILSLDIPTPLPMGSQITLISNDGTDAVIGGFDGLSGTTTLTIDGVEYTLTTSGGDGNDVVLSRGMPLAVTLVNSRTATFTDVDGDLVTIRTSRGTLDAGMFTLQPGGVLGGAQLQLIKLGSGFNRSDLTITARPQQVDGDGVLDGDGFVHVGGIDATGVDLRRVSLRGDLGFIDAGDANTRTAGIVSLAVHSIGRFDVSTQGPTPTLRSDIVGSLGRFVVQTDVFGGDIRVEGGAAPQDGRIGSIQIGAALLGGAGENSGRIFSSGDMGRVTIGSNIEGGGGTTTASLVSGGKIRSVTVGGDIVGGGGANGSTIQAAGNLGPVKVGGGLQGGSGTGTARIESDGDIKSIDIKGSLLGLRGAGGAGIEAAGSIGRIQIGGSLLGGEGAETATIKAGTNIGALGIIGSLNGSAADRTASITLGGTLQDLRIGGEVRGGAGKESGLIKPLGDLTRFEIRGSIVGGSGERSGLVEPDGGIGRGVVFGDIRGGDGSESGQVYPGGSISSLKVVGSVRGGAGEFSGAVGTLDLIRRVGILGDVVGGSGNDSGSVYSQAGTQTLLIDGSLRGGTGARSGFVTSDADLGFISLLGGLEGGRGEQSGSISSGGVMRTVLVGGSLIGDNGEKSASIEAGGDLQQVQVAGSLNSGFGERSASIRAGGILGKATVGSIYAGLAPLGGSITAGISIDSVKILRDALGTDFPMVISAPGDGNGDNIAIRQAYIGGNAQSVFIYAGADFTTPINGDANIGDVTIRGDFAGGSISAGISPGDDKFFGTSDDESIGGSLVSRIASITVGGLARGSRPVLNTSDHYAFIADEIVKVRVGGYLLPLIAGANNDIPGLSFGGTGDFLVREFDPSVIA